MQCHQGDHNKKRMFKLPLQDIKKVHMTNIPFQTIDWSTIEQREHVGAIGSAFWKTVQFEKLRIRAVEYSPDYVADHWCTKGHIVYCLKGEFESELNTGEKVRLTEGQTYVVSDDLSSHRSSTKKGVTLLNIDGEFLATS